MLHAVGLCCGSVAWLPAVEDPTVANLIVPHTAQTLASNTCSDSLLSL